MHTKVHHIASSHMPTVHMVRGAIIGTVVEAQCIDMFSI